MIQIENIHNKKLTFFIKKPANAVFEKFNTDTILWTYLWAEPQEVFDWHFWDYKIDMLWKSKVTLDNENFYVLSTILNILAIHGNVSLLQTTQKDKILLLSLLSFTKRMRFLMGSKPCNLYKIWSEQKHLAWFSSSVKNQGRGMCEQICASSTQIQYL